MGDVKGLYKKADDNPDFKMTGVHKDAPYEPPKDPEIHIDGGSLTVDQSVHVILDYLTEKGFLPSEPEDEEVGAKSIEEAGSESAEEGDASDSESAEEVHASDSESAEEVLASDSESAEEVHASDSESAEDEVARTVTKKTSFPSLSSTKKAVFNVSTKNTVKDDDEESADDSAEIVATEDDTVAFE